VKNGTDVRRSLEPQIQAISNAWRILGRMGLIDTIFNHISVVAADSRGDPYMMMNSYHHLPEELYPDLVSVFPLRRYTPSEADSLGVNPDGLQLHVLMHEARMRPGAIIHTHSVNAVAVGCSEQGLLPLSQTAMELVGEIEMIEYTGAFRSQPLNDQLRKLARNGGIALLRNHGSLVVADSISEAVYVTHYLEDACRIQVVTLSQGAAITLPDPRAVEESYRVLLADRTGAAEQLFAALSRQLRPSTSAYSVSTSTVGNP